MGVGEELKDREVSASLVKRAEAAGCKAIVLTLDVPALGKRERDVRNPFTLSEYLSLNNLLPAGCQELPKNVASFASLFDATLTWKHIEWLARLTKLPVLVKGILRADDALRASQTALARESTGREWSFPFEATSRWFEGVQLNSTVTQAKPDTDAVKPDTREFGRPCLAG